MGYKSDRLLVIDEVYGARFNPFPPPGGDDIPPHVFRLSKAFRLASVDGNDAKDKRSGAGGTEEPSTRDRNK
jgi:hypothetical protein